MAESHREEIAKLEDLYAGNPGGRVFVHLAEAYRKAGEHEHARRILSEGLERHADSASGYVVLGRVLADLEEDAEAESAFRRVLELDGGNLIALRWLGDLAGRSDRPAEAAAHYGELLNRNPFDDTIRDLLASAERAASDALPESADEAGTFVEAAFGYETEGRDEAETEQAAAFDGWVPETEEDADLADLEALTPPVVAPGFSGEGEPAELAYGDVELDALPGDLGSFAELQAEAEDYGEAASLEMNLNAWVNDAAEPPFEGALDADAAVNRFETLEGSGETDAEPLDVHVFDAADVLGSHWTPAGPRGEFEPLLEAAELDARELADVVDGGPDDAAFGAAEDGSDEIEFAEDAAFGEGMIDSEAVALSEPLDQAGDEHAETDLDLVAAPVDNANAGAVAIGGFEPGGFSAAVGGPLEETDQIDDGLQTETIAELYSSQGFHERAAEVYRALLRQRPGDERLSAILREAELAMRPPASTAATFEEDAAGEVWLKTAGWTEGGPVADVPTPYAWTEAGEEGPAALPIRSFLRDLIAWQPAERATEVGGAATGVAAEVAVEADEPELLLDEELPSAADAGPADDHAHADFASPPADIATGAAGAVPAAASTEQPPAPAALSPEPPERVRADDPWRRADLADEPWAAAPAGAKPAPIEAAAASATPATPAPPAAPTPPTMPPPAPPVARAVAAPVRRTGDPVEDAFLDWYGDGAVTPAEGSLAGAAPGTEAPQPAPPAIFGEVVPSNRVPRASATPFTDLDEGAPPEPTDPEEDEDLEMFRSWLQGLKK
ncbi:MAG: hypothetical protein WEF86_15490 [Gemmatimonadota bacterium]